jgi:hypothetical protein
MVTKAFFVVDLLFTAPHLLPTRPPQALLAPRFVIVESHAMERH